MTYEHLTRKAAAYLNHLSLEIDSRRVGSVGNQAATDFFATVARSFGFITESPSFACMDWLAEGVDLTVGGEAFSAFASPYSLGCRVSAPLLGVKTVDELAAANLSGHIVLLQGQLASEQLMPKNFPFYNPDHHRHIIHLLETGNPQAIIAATSRDLQMVGGMYPFPLIEDGDFDIPSVYLTDVEGERLARYAGQAVFLESRARRIPATGCNVMARKGTGNRRVVLFAHIDAKPGTPGACDNAAGVAVMLLLAELLADYTGQLGIEIVALNGEDYFSNPGEWQFLTQNEGQFGNIVLGINVDGAGYREGKTAYSLYGDAAALHNLIRTTLSPYPDLTEGEPWYQGDHSLFLFNQVPALAFTSERLDAVLALAHTPDDRPEMLDPAKLVTLALGLRDLLERLDQMV